MSRGFLDKFLLNDIDLKAAGQLVNYRITGTRDDFQGVLATAQLLLSVTSVVPDFAVGNSVVVSKGLTTSDDYKLLIGYVNKISVEDNRYVVEIETRFQRYNYKLIKKSYDLNTDPQAGVYSEIFKDIIEDGGLTASVEDSGTVIVATKYICNNESRLNRAERIRDILNWQMYDDLDNDYVRLEPTGYISYPTKLVVGGNVLNIPVWKEDLNPMRNVITIKGAYEEDTLTETFNGTGSEDTFTLSFTPETTECTVGGVLQTQGIPDQDEGYDYSLDKNLKTFTFEAGSIPAIGTGNVVMKYTTILPRPVTGKDYVSIGKYGYEKAAEYIFKDVYTVNDAKTRLKQLLSFIGSSFLSTTLYCYQTEGLKAGMVVDIEDSNNPARSGNYVVLEVKYQYPEPFDLVKVASTDFSIQKIFTSINARIEELERGSITDFGILNELFLLIVNVLFENRYFKLIKLVPDADVLYWDSEDQGDWGNDAGTNGFDWGDDSTESVNETKIVQGNNVYRELFYDQDFYDAVSSTGVTWDVVNREVTIVPSGVLYLGPLDVGQLRSYFNLSLQGDSLPVLDSLTVSVSGDNKVSYQSVSVLGVRNSFVSNDGTGVYIKIVNSSVADYVISATLKSSGNVDKAGVVMVLE